MAPVHPEYFTLPPLKRDVDGAKKLLAEAGYANGIELTIDVGNTDGPWQQTVCEILARPAQGHRRHAQHQRHAGSQILGDLGQDRRSASPPGPIARSAPWCSRSAIAPGVPWNETAYANPEFDAALDDAEATLDVEARRAKMEKVEKILQDSAVMLQPVWRPVYTMRQQEGARLSAAPDPIPPVQQGLDGRLMLTARAPAPRPERAALLPGPISRRRLHARRRPRTTGLRAQRPAMLHADPPPPGSDGADHGGGLVHPVRDLRQPTSSRSRSPSPSLAALRSRRCSDEAYHNWLDKKGLNVPFHERYVQWVGDVADRRPRQFLPEERAASARCSGPGCATPASWRSGCSP